MEALVDHLRERWPAYAGLAVCSLPLVYIFRRQVVPVLLWSLEIVMYMAGIHLCLAGLVGLAGWFKSQTSMDYEKNVRTGWEVPIADFWNREQYNPAWIFYLELVLLALVIFLVFRYRPLRIQKRMPRRISVTKGMPPGSKR